MPDLSFDEAVDYVMQQKAICWSFVPDTAHGRVSGGKIYVLEYNADYSDPDDDWPWSCHYSGGVFNSSSGEEENYGPDDVPAEARLLRYQPAAPTFEIGHLDYELQISLRTLRGSSFENARDDTDM